MNLPRVDVHAHFVPSFYRDAAVAAGHARPDGMPAFPDWDVETALSVMDATNVGTAIVSISSPGVHFGDDSAARELARAVNEEGARIAAERPGRFGFFASVPLPDVAGACAEAAYALDVLGADGIAVESNHRGIYLGDRRFDPFFAELDRRRSVVFAHPTSPACEGCETLAFGYPRPMLEFMFETTRAVTGMMLGGWFDRFPHVRLIVPHAAAALPVLADRVAGMVPVLRLPGSIDRDRIFEMLRSCYYDLAGYPLPRLLPALLRIADPGRLLYGSDWPFTPAAAVRPLAQELDETPIFDAEQRRGVLLENARSLFPRLSNA